LEIIINGPPAGEDMMISGFGKRGVKNKKERKGRNPATGEDVRSRPRRVVKFKYGGRLKDMKNGKLPIGIFN